MIPDFNQSTSTQDVTITQGVTVPAGNSSSVNLASGATWAGTPVSTLGVVGLQWNLNTDQNCTLYSEESEGSHTGIGTVATAGSTTLTGTNTTFIRSFVVGDTISVSGETDRVVATIVSDLELTVTSAFSTTDSGLSFTHYHWDISYHFHFKYKAMEKGDGETVQATMAYWRLRVVNEGLATTTFFRVSGVLCPIATPLPSSLSDNSRLKTETTITGRVNSERHAWVNPTNEQAISPVYRMVGTNFDGSTLDTNFWTDGSLLDGSVVQAGGEIDLHTDVAAGGTAASSAKYTSVRKARFVAGSAMIFEGGFNFKTAYTASNIRRVGAYTTLATINTPVDGFYFELSNAAFSVNSRANSGTVSSVASGSFNGEMGVSWAPTVNTYYKLGIEYTPLAAFFYVNGQLLHKKAGAHQSYFMTLPITIECLNTSGTTDVSFESVGIYIARQGELATNQTSKYITGISTTVCKRGAGVVKGIIITGVVDDVVINFYDGDTTGDTLLWSSGDIQAKTDYQPIPVDFFGMPFNDGLTVDIITQVCNVLVVYE
jgi:hypothetical protein